MATKYLFVSYAREDASLVIPIVEAVRNEFRLRGLNVDVWIDVANLTPGQSWDVEITRALHDSVGLLVFVSPVAMESAWVKNEIVIAAERSGRLIIPVILRHVPNLPMELKSRQWLDLSRSRGKKDIRQAAQKIAGATESHLDAKGAALHADPTITPKVVSEIAEGIRAPPRASTQKSRPPQSIFLVHGHDTVAVSEVETFLRERGVEPVILSKIGGTAQSLLQKFFTTAADARFAIAILSADDLGASRIQYDAEGVRDRALQFRARQNVILELGYFYGRLGWENVFVLLRAPDRVFPNFEKPSDLEGAVFDTMDLTGKWRESLEVKLREAGFRLKKQ